MKFNEKLIGFRKKLGLSQEELGYKLNVTRQIVSKWELGQETPEMDKLVEIAKMFNVSVDELVNEKEKTFVENTVIEDQAIGTGTGKENKVKFIIIALLVIILAWIFIKTSTGMVRFNKMTEEHGFFDKMFGFFDKTISSQENIIEGTEGVFNNVQNMMGNAFEQINVSSFNAPLEIYNGSNSGVHLKGLLDEIVITNKTKDKKITIKYAEKKIQDIEEVKGLKTNIKDNSNYEVSFEYDQEGYIYEVHIERAFSEFEKRSFNSSFELYAGSKMGSLVISALDKIITSNKTEERIITVKYMETETQNEEEIRNIKHSVDRFGDYELIYKYDEDGFIYKAIIEKI